MTNEEAIAYANCLKNNYTINFDDMADFCDMAIKALKQEIILDKIRDEIEQEYKVESDHPYGQGLKQALEIIDKHKAEREKIDCESTKCINCINHNYCDYEPQRK